MSLRFRFLSALLCAPLLLLALTGCPVPAGNAVGPAPAPPAPAASPLKFAEVAQQAGIDAAFGHGGRSPLDIFETIGGGCAFLDFDGDGWQDILLVDAAKVVLYRSRDGRQFEDATTKAGLTTRGKFLGAAAGDYDNDGHADLFLSGYGGNALYRNRGNGTFADVTAASGLQARRPDAWATSAGWADLDNDGRLDLVVGHYVTFTDRTEPQLCDYDGIPAACPPYQYETQAARVFRNLGGGRFQDVTTAWGFGKGNGANLGVACADFDGDGRTDVYVANDGTPGDLWRNRGGSPPRFENVGVSTGTAFNENGQPQAGMGADWGDAFNTGLPSLLVTTFQNEPVSLYRSIGGGQFVHASDQSGLGPATLQSLSFGVAFADYDNDGWLDVMMANGHVQDTIDRIRPPATFRQPTLLFHNRGEGRFEDVSAASGEAFAKPIVGRGLAAGDYDNDGRLDTLVMDSEGTPLLLRNESETSERWLGVELRGTKSNRDGLGARVTVTAGNRSWTRQAQTARSYLSSCDKRVHFGLGPTEKLDTLEVHWPSGTVTRLANPPLDQYLKVREGQ